MAQLIILLIVGASLIASFVSVRVLLRDWRQFNKVEYGTMNFDEHSQKPDFSVVSVCSHLAFCAMSFILLISGLMMFHLLHNPILL